MKEFIDRLNTFIEFIMINIDFELIPDRLRFPPLISAIEELLESF